MNNRTTDSKGYLAEAQHPLVHDHFCLLYDSESEWKTFAAIFIKTGLEQGEKCLYIFDIHTSHQVHEGLRSEGIDVSEYESSGQLTIVHGNRVFTNETEFDPDEMATYILKETAKALAEGYPVLRVTAETGWVLRYKLSSQILMHYEAGLDLDIFNSNSCLMVCQYDMRLFSTETINALIISHKGIIYQNRVHSNFYYLPANASSTSEGKGIETASLISAIEREELRAQTQQTKTHALEVLLEESQSIIIMVDKNGRIIDVNHLATGFFELGHDELTGRFIRDFMVNTEYSKNGSCSNPFGIARNGEIELQINGRVKTLYTHIVSVFLEGRQIYIATGQDITLQKKAEQTLKDSEGRFYGLFGSMQEAVALHELVLDEYGRPVDYLIREVNPAFEKLTGIHSQLASGQLASVLYRNTDPPNLKRFAEVAQSGQPAVFEAHFPQYSKHYQLSVFATSRHSFAVILAEIAAR